MSTKNLYLYFTNQYSSDYFFLILIEDLEYKSNTPTIKKIYHSIIKQLTQQHGWEKISQNIEHPNLFQQFAGNFKSIRFYSKVRTKVHICYKKKSSAIPIKDTQPEPSPATPLINGGKKTKSKKYLKKNSVKKHIGGAAEYAVSADVPDISFSVPVAKQIEMPSFSATTATSSREEHKDLTAEIDRSFFSEINNVTNSVLSTLNVDARLIINEYFSSKRTNKEKYYNMPLILDNYITNVICDSLLQKKHVLYFRITYG